MNTYRFCWAIYGENVFDSGNVHSKLPEVVTVPFTTSQHTINVLMMLFSRYGLPEQIVSDNGPQF